MPESRSKSSLTASKRSWGSHTSKWLLAGLAVATIGVGVGIADWARGPGFGHGWQSRGAHGPAPQGIAGLCERDPIRFEGVARAFLKADLDLKPTQNDELDKLAGILVPSLKELRDELCDNFGRRVSSTAPERLERFAKVLLKAAETAQKTVAPANAFYATLDAQQRARLDELTDRRAPFGSHR